MSPRKIELHLISVEDAAKRLGFHHRTIRRKIAQGQLTGYRVGGWAIRVDRRELDDLVRPIAGTGARCRP